MGRSLVGTGVGVGLGRAGVDNDKLDEATVEDATVDAVRLALEIWLDVVDADGNELVNKLVLVSGLATVVVNGTVLALEEESKTDEKRVGSIEEIGLTSVTVVVNVGIIDVTGLMIDISSEEEDGNGSELESSKVVLATRELDEKAVVEATGNEDWTDKVVEAVNEEGSTVVNMVLENMLELGTKVVTVEGKGRMVTELERS